METFDYIIIGAGSTGCVLANRLSENPSLNILLIEAGGSDKHPYIQAPAGSLKTFDNLRFNWCYQGGTKVSVWDAGLSFALNSTSGPSFRIVLFNFEKRHKDFVFEDLKKVRKQRFG